MERWRSICWYNTAPAGVNIYVMGKIKELDLLGQQKAFIELCPHTSIQVLFQGGYKCIKCGMIHKKPHLFKAPGE